MSDRLSPLVPGNEYAVGLRWKSGAAYNPAGNRAQFVFDSPPTLPTRYRLTKVYNPAGGSDSGMSASGQVVVCTLTPAETAAMGAWPGDWQVSVSVGPAATQAGLPTPTRRVLPVQTPDGGAVPHG